ncbi:hypothetical protein QQ045_004295 [Rhodiola kirilowii]
MSGEIIDLVVAGWRGTCKDVVEAEAMAIVQGMDLAQGKEYKEVIIFSDSIQAIMTITKGWSEIASVNIWVVKQAFQLLEENHGWSIEHVHREDNVIADQVAHWARRRKVEWTRTRRNS